ncbi:MAG: hypothetical protein LBI56_00995 [Puniceicoccales bacterium]|jgi:hypothetical protein|nr:hypothetical protein [Puniceicoccales bacterium]
MHINPTVFATSIALVLLSVLIFSRNFLAKTYNWLIFSKNAPFLTMGTGGIWFLVNVLRLSPADFGEYRVAFFTGFGVLILLSFFKMRELLAVRGVAVLMLLSAGLHLKLGSCESIFLKSFFISFVYLTIVLAMLIGSLPYILRDFMQVLLESGKARCFCGILSVMLAGLVLCASLYFER